MKLKGFNNGSYITFSDEVQPQDFVASTEFALQREDISSLDFWIMDMQKVSSLSITESQVKLLAHRVKVTVKYWLRELLYVVIVGDSFYQQNKHLFDVYMSMIKENTNWKLYIVSNEDDCRKLLQDSGLEN